MENRSYLQSMQYVDCPSDTIWNLISSGIDVEKWHPLINNCTLRGSERVCKTSKGDLHETILVNDPETRTYKYLVHPQNVYPHKGKIWSTLKVIDSNLGTLFLWDIEFEKPSEKILQEIQESFVILSSSAKNMIDSL